jgi:cytochrome c oxidase assembly factor CtaG
VTERAVPGWPAAHTAGRRRVVLGAAALIGVLTFVPPLSSWAGRYESGEVLRFGLWAIAVPPLVALGTHWPSAASWAGARARHPGLGRVAGFLLLDWLVMVWWFTPLAVRTVATDPWLVPVEVLTLLVAGVGLWLELVESPPLVPRVDAFRRAVLGALTMWFVWTEAYLVGMSQSGWYRNFSHGAGHGLSRAADQQVAAAVLWFIATVVFVPVIFANAMRWLHGEEEPDAELRKLVRADRRGVGPFMERRGTVVRGEGGGSAA